MSNEEFDAYKFGMVNMPFPVPLLTAFALPILLMIVQFLVQQALGR